jgi:hypothetical protein
MQLQAAPWHAELQRAAMQLRTAPWHEELERAAMQLRTVPWHEELERVAMQLRTAPWHEELERAAWQLRTNQLDHTSGPAGTVSPQEAGTRTAVADEQARPPRSVRKPRPRPRAVARLERRVASLEEQFAVWEARWFLTQLEAPHPEDDD